MIRSSVAAAVPNNKEYFVNRHHNKGRKGVYYRVSRIWATLYDVKMKSIVQYVVIVVV